MELDENEDCWLTPYIKKAGDEKPFNMKDFLGEVHLSDKAAALSNHLATVKRQSECYDYIGKKHTNHTSDQISKTSSGIGLSFDSNGHDGFSNEISFHGKIFPDSLDFSPVLCTSVSPTAYPLSSTPREFNPPLEKFHSSIISSISPINTSKQSISIQPHQIQKDEEEVFYDALDVVLPKESDTYLSCSSSTEILIEKGDNNMSNGTPRSRNASDSKKKTSIPVPTKFNKILNKSE